MSLNHLVSATTYLNPKFGDLNVSGSTTLNIALINNITCASDIKSSIVHGTIFEAETASNASAYQWRNTDSSKLYYGLYHKTSGAYENLMLSAYVDSGTTKTSALVFNLEDNAMYHDFHLYPQSTETYNIGTSSSKLWNNAYLSGTVHAKTGLDISGVSTFNSGEITSVSSIIATEVTSTSKMNAQGGLFLGSTALTPLDGLVAYSSGRLYYGVTGIGWTQLTNL